MNVPQTLKAARQFGDFLLVGIHTDLTVRCVSFPTSPPPVQVIQSTFFRVQVNWAEENKILEPAGFNG
jgi:hypothetical protein